MGQSDAFQQLRFKGWDLSKDEDWEFGEGLTFSKELSSCTLIPFGWVDWKIKWKLWILLSKVFIHFYPYFVYNSGGLAGSSAGCHRIRNLVATILDLWSLGLHICPSPSTTVLTLCTRLLISLNWGIWERREEGRVKLFKALPSSEKKIQPAWKRPL